jgi:KaiC/GvpD/RAD55 family RecA-like ATPase
MKLEINYKTIVWQKALFECTEEQKEEILKQIKNEDLSCLGDEELGFIENQLLFEYEDLYEDPETKSIEVEVIQNNVEIYKSY